MLIDVKQLQKELSVSRRTVFELIKQGLPTVRLSERILRFDPDEVHKWIKSKAS
jgi:predicted DNA-binding transcriptional regulator AlpA